MELCLGWRGQIHYHLPQQYGDLRASLVAQLVNNLPAVQETWVRSLLWEDAWGKKRVPLQYSSLENSIGYIVHGVTKSRTRLNDFRFHRPGIKTQILCKS